MGPGIDIHVINIVSIRSRLLMSPLPMIKMIVMIVMIGMMSRRWCVQMDIRYATAPREPRPRGSQRWRCHEQEMPSLICLHYCLHYPRCKLLL